MTTKRNLGLTLAGGGNRAFYQSGLLAHWHGELLPRTAAVACCSAGACVITVFLTGRENQVRDFWKQRRQGVTRNLDWRPLLSLKSPAPHAPIYRDTLEYAYRNGGLERIQAQPFPIFILCAAYPRLAPGLLMAPLGFSGYTLEKRLKPDMLHPKMTPKLGFEPYFFDARQCQTPEELADLVMASSATPPFTPIGNFRGKRLLDGGLIDNVPADICETEAAVEKNLVLLSRPYPQRVLGFQGRRLYLAPSRPVPVSRWDYTRPDQVDATFEMGAREAVLHRSKLDQFLAES